MRRALFAFAALACLSVTAQAETDDAAVFGSLTPADMQTLVTEAGYEFVEAGFYGANSVKGRDNATGLNFHLIGTACDQPDVEGCLGLWMLAYYDADGSALLERMNLANWNWLPVSVFYTADQIRGEPAVVVSRYVILDGGVTWYNLEANLQNFMGIVPQAADFVWETGTYAPGAEVE